MDLISGKITIPAFRMKGKRAHVIPITGEMRRVLGDALIDDPVGEFVFSSTLGHKPYQAWSRAKRQFDKLAALSNHWVYHDIRRTVRTGMARLGTSRDICERILAHAPDKLDQVYDHHDYLPQIKNALDAWGQHVAAVVEGREFASNVEPLPQRMA